MDVELLKLLKIDLLYKEKGIKGLKKPTWSKIQLNLQGSNLVFKGHLIDVLQVEKVRTIGKTVVWKDQKLYYIFEVKCGSKKEKFATDLPQDAENWVKAIEQLMPKPNLRASSSITPSESAKISLSAAEWTSKGKQMLHLLNGEEVLAIFPETTCELSNVRKRISSVDCFVTNFRIYVVKADSEFYSDSTNSILQRCTEFSNFVIPIISILKVEEHSPRVEISCRDGRKIYFRWEHLSNISIFQYYVMLKRYVEPKLSFAYALLSNTGPYDQKANEFGYFFYHPIQEFSRMGIPNDFWKVSDVNADYSISATYPKHIAHPALFDERKLDELGSFRTKNRLPALSWAHPKHNAGIVRCSQPKRGVTGLTNEVDKHYIKVLSAIGATGDKNTQLMVYDARSKVAAMGNRGIGGGFEDYSSTKICFLDIENIHVVRVSWNALMTICLDQYNGDDFFVKVYETGWHKLLSKIMDGAYQLAQTIEAGESVLCHCSDGWDRTAQLTAIAMIMLDPYYRTFDGILCLIEKEWLSFGHQFHLRLGLSTDKENESPIFFQFLECVYNLLKYYPTNFEFNEDLLVAIVDQLHNGCFGTFMYNTEAARVVDKEYEKTMSIWSYIMMKKEDFLNPWFQPQPVDSPLMKIEVRQIQIWEKVFQRWDAAFAGRNEYQANLKSLLQGKQDELNKVTTQLNNLRTTNSRRQLGFVRSVVSNSDIASDTQREFGEELKVTTKSPRADSNGRNAKLSESKQESQSAQSAASTQSLPVVPSSLSASSTPTTPHKLSASASATDLSSPRASKPMPPIPVRSNTLDQLELVDLKKKNMNTT